MDLMKCVRCELIERNLFGGCSRCGGDLVSYRPARAEGVSIWAYPAILFVGLVVSIVSLIIAWNYGFTILVLTVSFRVSGVILGSHYRGSTILGVAAVFSLPYILSVSYLMVGLLPFIFDREYDGHFWHTEFFIAPLFLYLAPVLACGFGAQAAAKQALVPILLLVFTLALAFMFYGTVGYSERTTRKNVVTFDLVNNEDVYLQAEIRCEFTVAKDYWTFRNYDRGDCRDTRVTVVRKREGLSLPIDGYWTLDGAEEHVSIWPINLPDDGAALDYTKPTQTYDDVPRWRTECPFIKIAMSRQASFRWGEIHTDLSEEQYAALKKMVKGLGDLAK
jgi:hypothetical protein